MKAQLLRSCCDDTSYQIRDRRTYWSRGLKTVFAEQLPGGGLVEVVILPESAVTLREQIIKEAAAMMKIEDERILVPLDVVEVDIDQLGLVYPFEQQVSIARVFEKYEHAFSETAAVKICTTLLELLHVLHQHSFTLGGVHGDNVQILGRKRVRLGPIVPDVCKCFLSKSRVLFQAEYSLPQEMNETDDIYGIAVLLLCFLQKNLWSLGSINKHTQSFVKQEGLQDYIDTIPDVSDDTMLFLSQALHIEPEQRYKSAQVMMIDLGRSLAGLSLRIGKSQSSADGAMRSDLYNTKDIQEHINKKASRSERPAINVNHSRIKALTRLVVLDEQELTARINLAPGTSFPRDLLMKLLAEVGVVYGIDDAAVNEATMPLPEVRRIVLAHGDSAHPGRMGKGVRGEPIEAPRVSIDIEIVEDGMRAIAHSRPKQAIRLSDIKNALNVAGVSFGIDKAAISRLAKNGSGADGTTVLARGKEMDAGQLGCYEAKNEHAELVRRQIIKRSDIAAIWQVGFDSKSGTKVTGDRLTVPLLNQKQYSELAGEGVEIHREQDDFVLRAKLDGLMQIAEDGVVSVVTIKEIYNDVAPTAVLDCDDAIVVYGSVLSGAKLNSRSGIQVEGDIGDAEIISSGDVAVSGSINAGAEKVQVAGLLRVGSIRDRSVVAQRLVVDGDIINAEIVSLGDVDAQSIINSQITAAGDINCLQAGSEDQSFVKLWAGHHVPKAIQREIAQLQEERLSSERVRMVKERNEIAQDVNQMKQQENRYKVGGFIKEEHLLQLQDRIAQIKARADHLQEALEDARHMIVDHKEQIVDLEETTNNHKSMIRVDRAFAGIELKLSTSATRYFEREQSDVIHRLQ